MKLPKKIAEHANYVELEEEERLFFTCSSDDDEEHRNNWYLDTGCTNHMCGNKELFLNLDESIRGMVNFGNKSKVPIMGKGKVLLKLPFFHFICEVFYVPSLNWNLLSMGQLFVTGFRFIIEKGVCTIETQEDEIVRTIKMTDKRLFHLSLESSYIYSLSVIAMDDNWLWHFRYGHLNFNSLKLLSKKNMVTGLPLLDSVGLLCEGCVRGKQHRYSFPDGKSQRAHQQL